MAKPITFVEAITEGLREEMQRDPDVFLLGQDIGVYGGAFGVTKGLIDDFGKDRVWDTPLSETAIIGNAIGAAMYGLRPVAEMQFADFVACGFNQLINNAAKMHYRWGPNVPMTLRLPWGGGVSGGPFHSGCMEAWFLNVPGLKLICPSTPRDAKAAIKAAIRDDNPVLYFEHKHMYRDPKLRQEVGDVEALEIGKSRIARPGRDATVVTFGIMVHYAEHAAENLAKEGVEVEVLDLLSLRPYDTQAIIDSVTKTSRALVVNEATLMGSVAGEFASFISEHCFEALDAPVMRMGALECPIPYAPELEQEMLPNAAKIEAALRKLVSY
ncbi:MAG: alpha-ketoacid dehydrogenase subunit beta [Planctomycetes bacterium]|nr:alpha-ketoacid dehydrogenase subunit beta [Planctomycetota bacterium]MCW8135371.1 alpha-ketoacid dehydrogenase subunit beta [Planctomycetota bacterium]